MDKNKIRIPFNKPFIVGKELYNIAQAVFESHISGDGPFTGRCHKWLENRLGCAKALLTHSCTGALEMAAMLCGIGPGDEVVMPSYTFVSTANAFVLRGARIRFLDIRPDTLNIDERLIESAINEHTKVIVPVHYAGVGCEMDAIMDRAQRHGLAVIEDNAHGLLGKYRGRYLGTFGQMAAQSFHETKNFICGEGGALLLNDPALVDRAEVIREKGTNRSSFFRGEVDRYTWVDLGSSYLPSDILAAFLCAQLEAREEIQARRQHIWNRYHTELSNWCTDRQVRMPVVPEHCEHPWHMFYLLLPSENVRQALIEHLKDRDILSVFHYLPLHLSRMGKQFGGEASACPVTEDISARLLRLPFYNQLHDSEQDTVIQAICDFSGA